MATSRLPLAALLLACAGCATPAAVTRSSEAFSLRAADGQLTTLTALRSGADATVLVFWSAGCPCVRRYQARVDALLDEWPRVRVLAISSNAGESFEAAQRAGQERGMRVPLYRDEGGRLAQSVGARSTPTVVVLDAAGEVRFLGWLDNERQPGEPGREPWLQRALEGVLGGHASFSARSPTWGCTLTRSLFNSAGTCVSPHP